MQNRKTAQITKNVLLQILICALVGVLSGALIFLFQVAAGAVIDFSGQVYAFVRAEPMRLPALLGAAVVLGLLSGLVLTLFRDCRGGGIPTAVASIRGLVPLKWIQGIFALFFSSMLTYLGGVPLGNEGPSVQMGAAVGQGTVGLFGKRRRGFVRYAMTGGACAGFAAATGAPLSGMIFALEEAHRRFSPVIFMVASVSVVCGSMTQNFLCRLFSVEPGLFGFSPLPALPLSQYWPVVAVGVLCGIGSILLTKLYGLVRRFEERFVLRMPYVIKIACIFFVVALLGFVSGDFIGSGHHLIEKIMARESLWYVLISALLLRALLLTVANSKGVSGGLFVPTLAFGAILGGLLGEGAVALGVLEVQYYPVMVCVGMAAFLAGASQTPITAIAFAAEALAGAANLLPVAIAVSISYLFMEVADVPAFAETVIHSKEHDAHVGKAPISVDTAMTVGAASFADGKELRDILWPPTCTVLSVERHADPCYGTAMGPNDKLYLHYTTYDPELTQQILVDILGEQVDGIANMQSNVPPTDLD